MPMQSNELNFKGQNIYVGIDVHLKSWTVSILTEKLHHKTFTQQPCVEILSNYLHSHFPGASYYSVYEAGFSGFWAHYRLEGEGISNIIVNPADVPTSQKESLSKTDSVDSRKLARSLRGNELVGIYIPTVDTLEARTLFRCRDYIVKDLNKMKQRLKSQLYFYGIKYPDRFQKCGTHWSRAFIKWLREDVKLNTEAGMNALRILLDSVETQRKQLLNATRKLRELSQSERYAQDYNLLRSIPGFGMITAMALLVEIEDVSRFRNSDKLAGYVGLIPTTHSSGEKDNKGEITFRGQKHLRNKIIESSWIAARMDPAMHITFLELCKRMDANKAIVRIARKLLNRVFYVLKYKKRYEYAVIK